MTIGSVSGAGIGLNRPDYRANIKKGSGPASAPQFPEPNSSQIRQFANNAGIPEGAQPPKELSQDDLGQIKEIINRVGGTGADKIDDLIKNFDQYDKNGTGKISIEQFKDYADKNGVQLPRPPSLEGQKGNFAKQDVGLIPSSGSPAAKQSAVAGFVSKYASSVSSRDVATTSATPVASNAPSTSKADSSTSSSSVAQKSDAELQRDAAAGDVNAQKELDRRKAKQAPSDANQAPLSAAVSVEA